LLKNLTEQRDHIRRHLINDVKAKEQVSGERISVVVVFVDGRRLTHGTAQIEAELLKAQKEEEASKKRSEEEERERLRIENSKRSKRLELVEQEKEKVIKQTLMEVVTGEIIDEDDDGEISDFEWDEDPEGKETKEQRQQRIRGVDNVLKFESEVSEKKWLHPPPPPSITKLTTLGQTMDSNGKGHISYSASTRFTEIPFFCPGAEFAHQRASSIAMENPFNCLVLELLHTEELIQSCEEWGVEDRVRQRWISELNQVSGKWAGAVASSSIYNSCGGYLKVLQAAVLQLEERMHVLSGNAFVINCTSEANKDDEDMTDWGVFDASLETNTDTLRELFPGYYNGGQAKKEMVSVNDAFLVGDEDSDEENHETPVTNLLRCLVHGPLGDIDDAIHRKMGLVVEDRREWRRNVQKSETIAGLACHLNGALARWREIASDIQEGVNEVDEQVSERVSERVSEQT